MSSKWGCWAKSHGPKAIIPTISTDFVVKSVEVKASSSLGRDQDPVGHEIMSSCGSLLRGRDHVVEGGQEDLL